MVSDILFSDVSTQTRRVLTTEQITIVTDKGKVIKLELNDRKLKILHAIISSYIDTAEPVGSRTISKNFDLGISPATIRNEMSDLEELGFIVQPHTSSGRIPSDRGYRLYVDMLLENQKAQMTRIALLEELVRKVDRIENLLQDIATVLAKETKYTTVITSPQFKNGKLKNIQLINIDKGRVMAVIVTDSNLIKNHIIDLDVDVKQEDLNRLTYIMNEHLYNLTLDQIHLPLIQKMKNYAKEYEEIIPKVLDAVFKTIEFEEPEIYTSGTTNILKFPEFNDINKAMELIDALEEKDTLKSILATSANNEGGISIRIGEEIEVENMKDCSVITASYCIGDNVKGAIGIIGPKRMDYLNTITSLKSIIKDIENKLKGDVGS